MSYRVTTILLVVLVAFAGYMYFFGASSKETTQKPADDNLQVLNLDVTSLNSIEVRKAGSVVQVKKSDDGSWQMIKPEQFAGDKSRLDSLAYAIGNLRASRVVADKADDLATYGLDKPDLEAVLGTKNGISADLLIGSPNPATSGNYAKRADSDTIYLVGTSSVSQLQNLVSDPPKAQPTPTALPAVPTVVAPPSATGTPIG